MKWLYSLLLGILLATTVQSAFVTFYPKPQVTTTSVILSSPQSSVTPPPQRCYKNKKTEQSLFCKKAIQNYTASQAQQNVPTSYPQTSSTETGYQKNMILLSIFIGGFFVVVGFLLWQSAKYVGTGFFIAALFIITQVAQRFFNLSFLHESIANSLTSSVFSYIEFAILFFLSVVIIIVGYLRVNKTATQVTTSLPPAQKINQPSTKPMTTLFSPRKRKLSYIIVGGILFLGVCYFYFTRSPLQATVHPPQTTTTIAITQPSQISTSSQQSSNSQAGWVHTSGTAIIDGSGNHIYLSGVDEGGHMLGNPTTLKCSKTPSPATSAQISSMHQMGFNTNRIGITWANLEPSAPTVNPDGTLTHHWNQQYLADIDTQVQYLKQNGMMAILDMHQASWSSLFTTDPKLCQGSGMPAWLYTSIPNTITGLNTARCEFFSDVGETNVPEKPQEGFAAVWAMLASRYATNATVIGADMFNEPNWPATCTSADLASFYEKIGAAIRSTNQNIILMYEEAAYQTYMRVGFKLARKPNLTNAIYSWHFYPPKWDTASAQTPLAVHLSRAHSWNVPLWIGESDAMGETRNPGTDSNWQQDLTNQMNYFKQNDISWTLWAYDTGCCSIVAPNTNQPKQQLVTLLKAYLNIPASQ